MKRMAMALAVVLAFCAAEVHAAKTTYIVTNNRFNYVKLKEVGGKEAEALRISHPATIDEAGLRAALASIGLSRSYVVKKEVDTQQVFDDQALGYLAPALVRAFAQANPQEVVVFSYLSKNPYFIIRNDRLNICKAWVSGDELHVKFEKLYAKLFGDTDKRGNEAKLIAQAKGLRVKLDLGEGQKLGVDDTDEVVLSLGYNYVKRPAEPEKPITEGVTMSGQKVPLEGTESAATPPAPEEKASKKKGKAAKGEIAAAPPPAPVPQKSARERLEELNQLRKDKLIDQREYEEKKKEILKEL